MSFGERLKKQRELKELSQQELANRLNLSQSTIAYYELDKKQPPHATLNRISSFFSVSTDYLLGRTDDPSPTATNNNEMVVSSKHVIAFSGGPPEEMDEEEAEHVKEALEMFRAFREKKRRDSQQKNK